MKRPSTSNEVSFAQPDGPDGPKLYVARVELTLARDDAYPLRNVPLRPDPLGQIADAYRLIDPTQSEYIEFIMDLVPLTRAATRRRRRVSIDKLQRATSGPSKNRIGALLDPSAVDTAGSMVAQMMNPNRAPAARPRNAQQPTSRKPAGIARMDQMREERMLAEALGDPEPHFKFQMFIRARSENKQRPAALIQAVLAALDQFDDHNQLKVVGLRLPLRFLSADSSWRRNLFDRRIDRWRFKQRRNCIVATSEIMGLLKPATLHCVADNVIRTGGMVPAAPRNLIPFDLDDPPRNTFLVGAVKRGQKEQVVGVPLDDTFFTYSPGKTRWGKTESSLARFIYLARDGQCATLFLDPHDDALKKAKPYLAGQADRIIELSTARRHDGAQIQIGWNPFAKANLSDLDAVATQTDLVVNSIAAANGWGNSRAPRTLAIARNSVQALMEISRRLPADTAPTIFQIPTLLNDEDFRRALIPFLSSTQRRFWEDVYPNYSDEAQLPLAGFISRLAGVPRVAALLGSSISNYHARTAIDNGAIILVRLGGNTDIDQLMASLVVYDLKAAVMSRYDIDPDKRRPIHAWFDEVQDYDSAIRGQISDILEQTAKFGMRLHLLNQQPDSLQKKTLKVALTNKSHLFATSVNEESCRLLARNMSSDLAPDVILETPRYNFVSQVTIGGETTKPFRMRGIGLEEAFGPPPAATITQQVQAEIDTNSGHKPIDQTLAELATLDERIFEHLTNTRRRPDNTTPAPTTPRSGRPALRIAGTNEPAPTTAVRPRRRQPTRIEPAQGPKP